MTKKTSWETWVEERLGEIRLEAPSQGALRRAYALGSELERRKRRVFFEVVEMLFDSAAEPAPAGIRGAASRERRMLYEVRPSSGGEESCQLDLRVRREEAGTLEVVGHLLPSWTAARVEIRSGKACRVGKLGPEGEFQLGGLPGRAEKLVLEIRGDVDRLHVPDVPVPAPEPKES